MNKAIIPFVVLAVVVVLIGGHLVYDRMIAENIAPPSNTNGSGNANINVNANTNGGSNTNVSVIPDATGLIKSVSPSSIIYHGSAASGDDMDLAAADCLARGGQFNECGSACDTAENCATVCVPMCILLPADAVVQLRDGWVSTLCVADNECVIVDSEKDYSQCCSPGSCSQADNRFVSVNLLSFNVLHESVRGDSCDTVDCPDYAPCQQTEEARRPVCVNQRCAKAAIVSP